MTEEKGSFDRPGSLRGSTLKIATGCGNLYVTVNYDDSAPVEVFATLGKAGNCAKSFLEALTRSITLGAKHGVPIDEYVEELKGIRCPLSTYDEGIPILSCPDAVSKALEVA